MKLIATADERNPLITTIAGITGGAVSFIMPFIDAITRLSQCIGSTGGAILVIWAIWDKVRARRKQKLLESIPPREPKNYDPDYLP